MSGKKREAIDLETLSREIRRQLNDQQVCLDLRTEGKLSLLNDFQEFFRKRGELELEHARSLDKLVDRFERLAKQRNPRLDLKSPMQVWNNLMAETRRVAKEHCGQAEVYSNEMTARFDIMTKDVHVLSRRCKDICTDVQDSLLHDIKELNEQSKAYQYSCLNCSDAYGKLCKAREKVQKANAKRKDKREEQEKERERLFLEAKFRQLKFRNEFILGVSSSNAVVQKYFSTDILDIIETVDFDFHDALRRGVEAYREAEHCMASILMTSASTVEHEAKGLNFISDRAAFMQDNQALFTPPPTVQFIPFSEDEASSFMVTEGVQEMCEQTYQGLLGAKDQFTADIEEDAKTLEHMNGTTLDRFKIVTVQDAHALLEGLNTGDTTSPQDLSKSASFDRGLSSLLKGGQILVAAHREKKANLEFTLQVFHRKLQNTNKLARASAKAECIEREMNNVYPGDIPGEGGMARRVPTKDSSIPKLFGGSLIEYVEVMPSDIPTIVRSCVQAISDHGMDMEGIFRVPGPAQHVDDLRKAFEDGVDPLGHLTKKKNTDIAAIASVLKQYFRDLAEPLFPVEKYHEFVESARIENTQERCEAIKATLTMLHPAIIRAMKFLFSFLYKVSTHEDKNKMSTANLALVFGPTLTLAPPDIDPRRLHNDVPAVNVLIQTCLEHHEFLFQFERAKSPEEVAPPGMKSRSKSPEASTMSPRVSSPQVASPREPSPRAYSPRGPSPRQSSPLVHTPTPPPATEDEKNVQKLEGLGDEDQGTEDRENGEEEEEDEDTDTEEEIMTLNVKAIFDYTARNEKELSFSQGDMLHVIEKTPDNNWWDGMFQDNRGFIPVAYVEIVHPSGSMTSLTAPVPAPPARFSSLPVELPEDPLQEKTADKAADVETMEDTARKESVTEHTEEAKADTASPEELAVEEVMPVGVTEVPIATVVIPEEQQEARALSPDGQQETRTRTTSSPPQDNLTAGSYSLPRNLSPVTEDVSVKPRVRAGSSTTTALKSRIAAFESPQQGLSAPSGTSGHQRSVSVDDPMLAKRASDGQGIKKLSSAFDPSNTAAQHQVQHKPVVVEKGPKVKEMAQQQGLPFTPMAPGQFPVASPLQRSVLLRQTEAPSPPPDDSKKKAGKPPILARPARLSSKRDAPPPPKPKGDQLSAELKVKLGQTKSQPQ